MTPLERALANAAIIAGITFLSTLSIDFPPTAQNIWAAFIGASLSLLTQLKTITESDPDDADKTKPKPPLGMLI